MADPQIRKLARRLSDLERQALRTKQPTLGFSSIDGGALQANDDDGIQTMIMGQQFDGTNTSAVITGPTPPQPLIPGLTVQPGALRIFWDGTFTKDDVAPMDFARVLVYATPLAEFSSTDPLDHTIIVGQFNSTNGGEMSAILEPSTEYAVYLVSWTQAGKYSLASDVAVATTGAPAQGEQGEQGIPGVPGPPGDDGESLFTWVKYADTPTTGISDDPTGKTYIGLAYNKTTATESVVYADYAWSLIKGADGTDGAEGVPGPPGDDGESLFTWIKYADTPTTGISDDPTGKPYMGLAYNKTTATESTVYSDYAWSLIKGEDGSDAPPPPAPSTSPALQVYGNPRGLVIEALDVDGADGLTFDYHISTTAGFTPGVGTLAMTTPSTLINVEALPDTTPLVSDTTYYVKVIASNVSGTAPVGAEASGMLRLIDDEAVRNIAATKIVAGELLGAYALLGALNVGANISMTPGQGIVINLTDGGIIKFPSDGSPATITAELVALALTVNGALRILGLDNEIGQGSRVALSDGVSNPTSAPTTAYGWPRLELTYESTIHGEDAIRAIGYEDATYIYAVSYQFDTRDTRGQKGYLERINKATGATTRYAPNIFSSTTVHVPTSMVLGDTGYFYALFGREMVDGLDRHWRQYDLYEIDSNGNMLRTKTAVFNTAFGDTTGEPALVPIPGDVNNLGMLYLKSTNVLTMSKISYSTLNIGSEIVLAGSNLITDFKQVRATVNPEGVLVVQLPFAASNTWKTHWIALDLGDGSALTVNNSNCYPVATDPNFSASMHVQNASPSHHYYNGNVWIYQGKYEPYNGGSFPPILDDVVFTWRDSNAAGSGQHETMASPTRAVSYPPKATLTVTTPPIGVVTQDDSANSVRVYTRKTGGAATTWDRWDPADGVIDVKVIPATKAAANQTLPASNTFDAANQDPGSLISTRVDADGSLIDLKGDGSGRTGPTSWAPTGPLLTKEGQPYRTLDEVELATLYDTTTTSVQLSGMSITITSTGTTDVFEAVAVADIVTITGAATACVCQLRVDGTLYADRSIIFVGPTTNIRATASQRWKITGLAAGTHTVSLWAHRSGAGGAYRINATHTSLSVKRVAGS